MKHTLCWSVYILCLFVVGCSGEKTSENEKTEAAGAHAEPVEEDLGGPLEGEPTVEVWNWEQTLNTVHKHKGKVVVLHIWATWNEDLDDPANEGAEDRRQQMERLKSFGYDEFVRMKKLHREDVVAISLNTDYNYDNQDHTPDTLKDQVLAFAKAHGANFEQGVSSVLEGDLQEALEINTTPAVFVFDKQGTLRKKFVYEDDPPFSYRKDVIPFVETLIKESPEANATKPEDDKTVGSSATGGVELRIRDWKGLQEMVAEAKGRIVVVDLWSTQCEPCLREYPNLVKLHNERRDDVACLSFNVDYIGKGKPEELEADVLEILKLQNSTLPNVMSKESDEQVYAQIDSFSIPVVQVYDRTGKLRKQFDESLGEFTYAKDVLPFVETLIQEK